MEQGEFLGFLGDCVRALLARYPTALLAQEGDGSIAPPATLEEECGLHAVYDGALLAGVIAGKSGKEEDRAAFLTEAEHAYRARWRETARGKRVQPRGW